MKREAVGGFGAEEGHDLMAFRRIPPLLVLTVNREKAKAGWAMDFALSRHKMTVS